MRQENNILNYKWKFKRKIGETDLKKKQQDLLDLERNTRQHEFSSRSTSGEFRTKSSVKLTTD